ncbi:MAG: DUF1295 domain-containing protein [Candidatus Sumerlaeia bacterium]|nr:DUF1295 domain-containing protein [Candidatus Sumerlaeia bacterium]
MAAVMVALWIHATAKRDASIVDVGWAYGVGAMVILFAALAPGDETRRIVVGLLGAAWSVRLGTYLLLNRVIGKQEDGRYKRMREALGAKANAGFFAFFQIQAIWAVMFAMPMMAVALNTGPFGALDLAGVAVWLLAVAGEGIADAQLAKWRGNPANKGRTCRAGLWAYSRHPNYFFEWIHWFGYILMAVGSPWFGVSIAGPILMLVFLFKLTGIPFTEAQALRSRGDDYRRYQEEVSIFIPWFPKKRSAG